MSTLDTLTWGSQTLIDQGTVLEGLFGYNPQNQVVPKVAQKWKSSDGGLVWTFWLRKNAKWSNGAPVTAQDFQYAWMRLLAPSDSTGAVYASIANFSKNAYTYHAGGAPASAVGIKVINSYELQLTLSGPHDILPDLTLAGSMPLYPPDVKAHPSDWWMPKYFVGNGPYVPKKFVVNGDISLVRNPDYVGHPGEKNVGNVQEIHLIPPPTVPVEDFESGALSAALVASPSDYKYVRSHYKAELHETSTAVLGTLQWDRSPDPSPLFNVKVRQAIEMAIDRTPIADPVLNGMVTATSIFGFPGWPTNSLEHSLPYNLAKARSLLAQAGYPDGKGVPTLYIYCQTVSNSPNSVATAEAVAQELKDALHLNFKIEPTNSTLWGDIVWGGLNAGILPGYVIGQGGVNWSDVDYYPIQANQQIEVYGTMGPESLAAYAAKNWYYPNYDPIEVKAWGSPTNAKLGVSLASWQPLIKAAKTDIHYLNAFTARQSATYRADVAKSTSESLTQELNSYIATYSNAKTAAAKHAAWQAFWEWVGTYSTGNGDASIGLNDQVYFDQHAPRYLIQWNLWQAELYDSASEAQAKIIAADMVNGLMQQGYNVPLYQKGIFVEDPQVTDVQVDPYGFGGFYQFQYVEVK